MRVDAGCLSCRMGITGREDLQIITIQGTSAAIALGEATARAVQRIPDAHCNGNMHAALDYAAKIKHAQKDLSLIHISFQTWEESGVWSAECCAVYHLSLIHICARSKRRPRRPNDNKRQRPESVPVKISDVYKRQGITLTAGIWNATLQRLEC